MAILYGTLETAERMKVTGISSADTVSLDAKSTAIKVDTLLVADSLYCKSAILYVNPKTLETWHEYIDRPPTQEEIMSDLITTSKEMNIKLDSIIAKLGITAVKV